MKHILLHSKLYTEETEEPTFNEVRLHLTLRDSNSFVTSHELQPYFSVNGFQYFGPLVVFLRPERWGVAEEAFFFPPSSLSSILPDGHNVAASYTEIPVHCLLGYDPACWMILRIRTTVNNSEKVVTLLQRYQWAAVKAGSCGWATNRLLHKAFCCLVANETFSILTDRMSSSSWFEAHTCISSRNWSAWSHVAQTLRRTQNGNAKSEFSLH